MLIRLVRGECSLRMSQEGSFGSGFLLVLGFARSQLTQWPDLCLLSCRNEAVLWSTVAVLLHLPREEEKGRCWAQRTVGQAKVKVKERRNLKRLLSLGIHRPPQPSVKGPLVGRLWGQDLNGSHISLSSMPLEASPVTESLR
jgi:hypothetical protein